MDVETRGFFDTFKSEILAALKESENHMQQLMTATINPISKDTERLREDISDLYSKDDKMVERVTAVEGRVGTIESKGDDRRFNMTTIISVVVAVISVVAVIVVVVIG